MEHINKNRSFSGCIREGYKLYRENMRNILISTWKQLTLTSILSATLITSLIYSDDAWLQVLLALASLEGLVFFKARVFDMIDYRPYFWNIVRMELVCLIAIIVLAVLGATAHFGLLIPFSPVQMTSLAMAFLLILLLPVINVCLDLMLEERTHPWRAYKTGLRRWGFLFLTLLLSAMICGVILCLVGTPLAIAIYSAASNEAGIVAGDPSGLPGYFPTLLFLTSLVTIYASLYIQTWQTFAMAFAHGSISYKHENA